MRVTSGFHCGVEENGVLLRHYAACSGNFLPTFQNNPKVGKELPPHAA